MADYKALPAFMGRRVEIDANGCWLWTGKLNPDGYGRVLLPKELGYTLVRTHRYTYETFVGPIPPGLVIDHLCRVRHCCNPDHLEAVTQRVNVLRGESPMAKFARATHCVHGHEFTPENTGRQSGDRGRLCRTCKRLAARAKNLEGKRR